MIKIKNVLLCIAFLIFLPKIVHAQNCENLKNIQLEYTQITSAQSVPAGGFNPPAGAQGPFKSLPEFCRVTGIIKPTNQSEIKFEVWMPASHWNGKFKGMGNGGFAGSIAYTGLAVSILGGYASASTDTGHTGVDASWARNAREKVIDYGYRAIHEMTDKAKKIINAYYGSTPKFSYFANCSNGGRQGLMEAQRYPNDYDGIIAGAPINYYTQVLIDFAWNWQATLRDASSYIPPSKLNAIESAAMAACDSRDGVKDGVIENPMRCRFDPSILLCTGSESNACLTQKQMDALKKIYNGPHDSAGKPVSTGFMPGGALGADGWTNWITGQAPGKAAQIFFASQAFTNMIYDNSKWSIQDFNVDRDYKVASLKLAQILNASDPNLSAFKSHGGKLILFHGWSDAALPPLNTVFYYQSIVGTMGQDAANSFVRLYMVPGMQHCLGGPGTDSFGAFFSAPDANAHNDMSMALEQWVENGVAPQEIVAAKRQSIDPRSPILRSRPLCPYPEVAHYTGSGSTDDAQNFTCVKE